MTNGEPSFAPPVQQVLAYPTRIKILGALAEATDPLPPQKLVSHADISSVSFYNHKDDLADLRLMEVVDVDGEEHYQLRDSPGATALVGLNEFLGQQLAEQGEVESQIDALLE